MKIHTDGACLNNPGAGGWAFIVDVTASELNRIYSVTNEQYLIYYRKLVATAMEKYCISDLELEPLPNTSLVWLEKDTVAYSGYSNNSTNNKMELTAAMMALIYLDIGQIESVEIDIFTDSKYLLGGISSWFDQWRMNNWKNSTGNRAKNIALWCLVNLAKHNVESKNLVKWHWVAGHTTRGTRICDVDLLAKNSANKSLYIA